MTDYSELKKLAEAATPGPWTWDSGSNLNAPSLEYPSAIIRAEAYEGMWFGVYESKSQNDANEEWFSAANPSVILALIAENEALREEISIDNKIIADRERLLSMFECPEHGKCVPYAMEQVEALRKDAGRYQWLRAQPTCYMTTEGWQIRRHWRDQNDSGRPHGIMSICLNEESLDGAIDDAMSKEAK